MSNEVKELKELAAKTIEEIHSFLVDTAKTIHAFAEIMYQEYKSSKLLADRLVDMVSGPYFHLATSKISKRTAPGQYLSITT